MWTEAVHVTYQDELLPAMKEVLVMPAIEQALAQLEGGGGGFTNAGVHTALSTCTSAHAYAHAHHSV